MKRKSRLAVTLSITLAVSMMAGCGNKQAEVKETAAAETANTVNFDVTTIGNVIENDSVNLSDLMYGITLEKGQSISAASFSYGGETVRLEDGKNSKTGTKVFTAAKDRTVKAFANENNVPNVTLTFLSATKTASDLRADVTITDKEKKTSDANVNIKVRVLPETIKPVKDITQNLKLSESLKEYDFDDRAKNIADKVPEAVSSITVKKSNVKFGKAGHYEVTYEIKVKPGDTVEVTTDVEVTDKMTEDVITDEKDTTAKTDSSTPAAGGNTGSAPAGGGSSSGSGTSNNAASDGSSNSSAGGGSSAEAPALEQHTHSWVAHTATKPVWVSNMVTVTDYGIQAAHAYDSRCSECSTLFGSASECSDHQFATGHGGRQNIQCTHTTQVVTGSHTEDHGHNETQSYTDYYYCSCGARK